MSYPPPPPPPPPPSGGFGGFGDQPGWMPPPGGMPYGAPVYGPDAHQQAVARLAAPATTMLVLSILGIALTLVGLVLRMLGLALNSAPSARPGGNAELVYSFGGVTSSIVSLAIGAFCVYGLLQLRQARSYGLALTGVIASMIPCLAPCGCINLFVGIWALVVMHDRSVRPGFTA